MAKAEKTGVHCIHVNGAEAVSDTTENLFTSHVGSHGVGTIKDARRSRITNGSAFLPNIDGRSAWIRRAKDLIASTFRTSVVLTTSVQPSVTSRAALLFSLSSLNISKRGSPPLVQPVLLISICINALQTLCVVCSKASACSVVRETSDA